MAITPAGGSRSISVSSGRRARLIRRAASRARTARCAQGRARGRLVARARSTRTFRAALRFAVKAPNLHPQATRALKAAGAELPFIEFIGAKSPHVIPTRGDFGLRIQVSDSQNGGKPPGGEILNAPVSSIPAAAPSGPDASATVKGPRIVRRVGPVEPVQSPANVSLTFREVWEKFNSNPSSRYVVPKSQAEQASPETVETLSQSRSALKELLKEFADSDAVEALPDSVLFSLLLRVFRPNEFAELKLGNYELAEWFVKISAEQAEIDLAKLLNRDEMRDRSFVVGEPKPDPGTASHFALYLKHGLRSDELQSEAVFDSLMTGPYDQYRTFGWKMAKSLLPHLTRKVSDTDFVRNTGDFLAAYQATEPARAGRRANIFAETLERFQESSAAQPHGPYMNIGVGEKGIAVIEALDRPLVLVEKDPAIAQALRTYARLQGKSDAVIVEADIRHASLTKPAGLIEVNYMLHYLGPEDIPAVVQKLVEALTPGGKMVIVEPESNCCRHSQPEKIKAIREALQEIRVPYKEASQELRSEKDPWNGQRRISNQFTFEVNKPEK